MLFCNNNYVWRIVVHFVTSSFLIYTSMRQTGPEHSPAAVLDRGGNTGQSSPPHTAAPARSKPHEHRDRGVVAV